MSRKNTSNYSQGNRLLSPPVQDLEQKLTYQQLLNLNHDITKENIQLKNIGTRLGSQLKFLHTQFQVKPREEPTQFYNGIKSHPNLHHYESMLLPLFDAYEYKIQEFELDFEQLHDEFFTLERRFEEVCEENDHLRAELNNKIQELLQMYENGTSQKLHSNYGRIIFDQISQKQRCLIEENNKLESDCQRYKFQNEKMRTESDKLKKAYDETKTKVRETTLHEAQLQSEVEKLKQSVFDLQLKISSIEADKKKIELANERALSQNKIIIKEKEMMQASLENLRKKIETYGIVSNEENEKKIIEQLNRKIAFLQAESSSGDYPKRFSKLQRDYENLINEKKLLGETCDSLKIKEETLTESNNSLRKEIAKIDGQKLATVINEERLKKSLESLKAKSKSDYLAIKKQKQTEIMDLQSEFERKLQEKQKKLGEIENELLKVKLERDKLAKENSNLPKGQKQQPSKNSQKTIEKLKQKLQINDQIFKQQIQIFQNDLSFMKKEGDSLKEEKESKEAQLKKVKAEYEQLKKEHDLVCSQKQNLIEDFRKVRDEYERGLKEREILFQQKIRQVKAIVQESDSKKRKEKEKMQENAKQYKKVLEDLKNTYETKIRQLESKVTVSYSRTEITPEVV